jgi:hypothetical protein
MFGLVVELALVPGCTFYGQRPAKSFADATGGESLERVFWKQVARANWTEIGAVLASNYVGMTSGGVLNHDAALAQYRQWQLKDYSLGDLETQLNGSTIVVTYTITLNGSAAGQPLPSTPQHMMTIWQQQKSGWVIVAHSVSQS